MPPAGLAAVQLYGVYAATERDDDAGFYRDIAHTCIQPHGTASVGPAAEDADTQRLLDGDAGRAVQELLGMQLFTGGMPHSGTARYLVAGEAAAVGAPADDCRHELKLERA